MLAFGDEWERAKGEYEDEWRVWQDREASRTQRFEQRGISHLDATLSQRAREQEGDENPPAVRPDPPAEWFANE